jgi:hypothetical protein
MQIWEGKWHMLDCRKLHNKEFIICTLHSVFIKMFKTEEKEGACNMQ